MKIALYFGILILVGFAKFEVESGSSGEEASSMRVVSWPT